MIVFSVRLNPIENTAIERNHAPRSGGKRLSTVASNVDLSELPIIELPRRHSESQRYHNSSCPQGRWKTTKTGRHSDQLDSSLTEVRFSTRVFRCTLVAKEMWNKFSDLIPSMCITSRPGKFISSY